MDAGKKASEEMTSRGITADPSSEPTDPGAQSVYTAPFEVITKKIDASSVIPSRWANRHEASFSTKAWIVFKEAIRGAGGNVQAILVRPVPDELSQYEVVFGHRRLRACQELDLPVLASICVGTLKDKELFEAMDQENRGHADLSIFEQGRMYEKALEFGMYPSVRKLADALGVSHTWVNKCFMVSKLPQAIVECFKSPLEIQFAHAEAITRSMQADQRGVLKRAEKLRGKQMNASQVAEQLAGGNKQSEAQINISAMGKHLGTIERKPKTLVVKMAIAKITDEQLLGLKKYIESMYKS